MKLTEKHGDICITLGSIFLVLSIIQSIIMIGFGQPLIWPLWIFIIFCFGLIITGEFIKDKANG